MAEPNHTQPVALTIGNFDGVHRGHAALVAAARDSVGNQGRVLVLGFDPNPVTLLRPSATPPKLSCFDQRIRWLRELGADEVVRLEPTREFLQQSAEQFLDATVTRWRPSFIIEGGDFRFGRARAGSIETLRAMESRFGYRTVVVDSVSVALADQSVARVSSTLVRWLVARGRVAEAAAALGRPHEIASTVVRGDQRGRTIGFATANLGHVDLLLPADGIYAGFAERDGRSYPAAISVGTKPTFGEHPRTCEAHLLDYDGSVDDYGWTIRLRFTHWLRDQLKYDDVDALIRQLHRDVAATRHHSHQSPGMALPGLWEVARA